MYLSRQWKPVGSYLQMLCVIDSVVLVKQSYVFFIQYFTDWKPGQFWDCLVLSRLSACEHVKYSKACKDYSKTFIRWNVNVAIN